MPHYETIPNIDDIAPEDLLPKTPKRGPKPPVQKETVPKAKSEPKVERISLLPKISIKGYQPAAETEQLADNMLREKLVQGQ